MKKRCVWCDITAYVAIAAGAVMLFVALPGWVYLLLVAVALIFGGLLWLSK